MNTDFKIVESILFYLESEIDVTSIIIGVVATLICRVATVQLQILQHKWKERLQFNLSGIWTCQFDSFVYDARSIIEIYNIVQKKDNLDFYIEHYSKDREGRFKASSLHGKGVIRGQSVSMYYVTDKKQSNTIGVAFLTLKIGDVDSYILTGNVYEDYSVLNFKKRNELMKRMTKTDLIILKKTDVKFTTTIKLKMSAFLSKLTYRNYDDAINNMKLN